MNRLKPKPGHEGDVYIEELQVFDITPGGCKIKSEISWHYKITSQLVFTYPAPYQFKINDFFPNIDKNLAVTDGTLPTVCPDYISAYDLSMNYHDVPYQGNHDQPNHFYWDENDFVNNPAQTLYQTGINNLWSLLTSLKAKIGDGEVLFNRNQVDIESITENDGGVLGVDSRYKVTIKTRPDSNFYVPNTKFDFYIAKNVYEKITNYGELTNPSIFTGLTKHYYLDNDIAWETANKNEIKILNFDGVLDGRWKKIDSKGTFNYAGNSVCFSGGAKFRNLYLTINNTKTYWNSGSGIVDSSGTSIFSNCDIENLYLNAKIQASDNIKNSNGIGFLAKKLFENPSGNAYAKRHLVWKRIYLTGELDFSKLSTSGTWEPMAGVLFPVAWYKKGSNNNTLTVEDVNSWVNFKGYPATIGGTTFNSQQGRWFGYARNDDDTTNTDFSITNLFYDGSNKIAPSRDYVSVKDVPFNTTNTKTLLTTTDDRTKISTYRGILGKYQNVEHFNDLWCIPQSVGRPIPQRAWAAGIF